MLDPIQLQIMDSTGQPLTNQFWPVDHPTDWLAILLPGLRYNSNMPLMYYPRLLLRQRNVTVLNLNPDTQSNVVKNANWEDQLTFIKQAVMTGLNAGLSMGDFRRILLVGKSIGTLAVAQAYSEIEIKFPTIPIWLTPLLRDETVMKAVQNATGPQVFICGGADPTFDNERLNRVIAERPRASAFVAPGANHSLESETDDLVTFRGISEAMLFLANFLDQNLNVPHE